MIRRADIKGRKFHLPRCMRVFFLGRSTQNVASGFRGRSWMTKRQHLIRLVVYLISYLFINSMIRFVPRRHTPRSLPCHRRHLPAALWPRAIFRLPYTSPVSFSCPRMLPSDLSYLYKTNLSLNGITAQ